MEASRFEGVPLRAIFRCRGAGISVCISQTDRGKGKHSISPLDAPSAQVPKNANSGRRRTFASFSFCGRSFFSVLRALRGCSCASSVQDLRKLAAISHNSQNENENMLNIRGVPKYKIWAKDQYVSVSTSNILLDNLYYIVSCEGFITRQHQDSC